VPVETANLNVFVIQLLDPRSHYQQIDNPVATWNMCRPVMVKKVAPNNGVGSRPSEVVT